MSSRVNRASAMGCDVWIPPVGLAGRLVLPSEALALVLFAHGGGSSRLSPRNARVAEALHRHGLGTLLFDLLTEEEATDRQNVFDIPLLADRLLLATRWLGEGADTRELAVGYFGPSTGAATPLVAAARSEREIGAIVSRGGRPDLAAGALTRVRAPTLLIVGSKDPTVLELNRAALAELRCEKELAVVAGATHLFEEPGALEEITRLAGRWFRRPSRSRRASVILSARADHCGAEAGRSRCAAVASGPSVGAPTVTAPPAPQRSMRLPLTDARIDPPGGVVTPSEERTDFARTLRRELEYGHPGPAARERPVHRADPSRGDARSRSPRAGGRAGRELRVDRSLFLSSLGLLLALMLAAVHPSIARDGAPLGAPPKQAEQYAADEAKTVVELQQFRRTREQAVVGPGGSPGTATLIDLNPEFGVWYLLTLQWRDGSRHDYHLENAAPNTQSLALEPGFDAGLVCRGAERHSCALWSGRELEEAAALPTPYAPLCGGRLFLHNAVRGHRTDLEAVVEFLRNRVWGGERVMTLAKETVLRNAGREQVHLDEAGSLSVKDDHAPAAARLAPAYAKREIGRSNLGIRIAAPDGHDLPVGRWIPARDLDGVFISLVAPEAIAEEILDEHRDRANALDAEESSALVYLIAFDLNRFGLGYGLGTDHPRVDWAAGPASTSEAKSMPGPDGISTIRPLVATGMIPPNETSQTVAAFAGGFKRYHGALRFGDLALRNHGSHYGFVQEGVVLSKLQPRLSTLFVLRDGSVHMHAWTEEDDRRLSVVRYARQNGVPLVEWDAAAAEPIPGALVNRWGPGGWSGSAEKALRTVRAGACLQEIRDRRYLIYAYFSNATPSAMARVFQSYGCHHAMQLDINAPILTYLAIYPGRGIEPAVQYLVQPMSEADQRVRGQTVPRFLALPDNRDFFYLMWREAGSS
jgi:predicted alpha/beta-hydrolase family hydrolase